MKNTKVVTQKNPEIVQDVASIQIPDLWHIASNIRSGADLTAASRTAIADNILTVWHLAHSLKEHILTK